MARTSPKSPSMTNPSKLPATYTTTTVVCTLSWSTQITAKSSRQEYLTHTKPQKTSLTSSRTISKMVKSSLQPARMTALPSCLRKSRIGSKTWDRKRFGIWSLDKVSHSSVSMGRRKPAKREQYRMEIMFQFLRCLWLTLIRRCSKTWTKLELFKTITSLSRTPSTMPSARSSATPDLNSTSPAEAGM